MFFEFQKKRKKRLKSTHSFTGHSITLVFNTQLLKVSASKSPTSNTLLRNADVVFTFTFICLQCFDAVGLAAVCKKTEWWGTDVVICVEQGADLHMAQLMPLPLTVSCSSKSRLVLLFWYRLTWVLPEKGPLNGCVCVCVCSHS